MEIFKGYIRWILEKGDGGDDMFDVGGLHSFLVQIFQFLAARLISDRVSLNKIKLILMTSKDL